MNSLQTTLDDTTKLLTLLEHISAQQKNNCKMLDDLLRLIDQPSSNILKVLAKLLRPIDQDITALTEQLKTGLTT
jgi:hypothetical protein